MTRALVMSGGGAKASYQVGALKHLIHECGRTYDIFCGNSAGALNAALMATKFNDFDALENLINIWMSVTPSSIYEPWGYSFLGPIGGILLGKPSLYNSTPLLNIVSNNICRDDLLSSGKFLTVGAVNLQTAEYKYWRENDEDIIQAIQASSAYPGAFMPVDIKGKKWIDAGVREFIPVAEAVSLGATEVDVIVTSSKAAPQFHPKALSVLSMIKRALEIILFRMDLWEFSAINQDYPGVKINLLYPTESLGSFIDFKPENIRRIFDIGYKDSLEFSNKIM